MVKTTDSSVGGVVDVEQDREPAAQRPAVRQPGDHDPRRRPGLPLRSDQEHAVLAADRGRQRPQRQLPDRRRRQQRRHRRRAAPALPARGDPGVQLRHAALQGGVRAQQRRRDEHRHQERHEQTSGAAGSRSLRDKSLNAKTETEKLNKVDKQDYRRYQYGGSFGGPIVQNKAHFFAAFERTQQDTHAGGRRRWASSRAATACFRPPAARTCSRPRRPRT